MRRRLPFLFMLMGLFACVQAKAQTNLVPNPSFEDLSNPGQFPQDFGELFRTTEWTEIASSSIDYFHANGAMDVDVPTNWPGTENAHHGDAYVGMIIRETDVEYLAVELDAPLVAGSTYEVRFMISLADNRTNPFLYELNEFGALFTSALPVRNGWEPILQTPQVEATGTCLDVDNGWQRIAGTFTVPGGSANLNFLTIGNFQDAAELQNTVCPVYDPNNSVDTYYYIDSVYVGLVPPPPCQCNANDYTITQVARSNNLNEPSDGCCYTWEITKKTPAACDLYGVSVMVDGNIKHTDWNSNTLTIGNLNTCVDGANLSNVSFGLWTSSDQNNFPNTPDCSIHLDLECPRCCDFDIKLVPELLSTYNCCYSMEIEKGSDESCDVWGFDVMYDGQLILSEMQNAGTTPLLDVLADELISTPFCFLSTGLPVEVIFYAESPDPLNPVEICTVELEVDCDEFDDPPGCGPSLPTPTTTITDHGNCLLQFFNSTLPAPAGYEVANHRWTTSNGDDQVGGNFLFQVPGLTGDPSCCEYCCYYPVTQVCLTVYYRDLSTDEICQVTTCSSHDCSPVLFGKDGKAFTPTTLELEPSLKVFPNPSSQGQNMMVEYVALGAGEANVQLFSIQGQLLEEWTQPLSEGVNQFPMEIAHPSSGVYLLQVKHPDTPMQQVQISIR